MKIAVIGCQAADVNSFRAIELGATKHNIEVANLTIKRSPYHAAQGNRARAFDTLLSLLSEIKQYSLVFYLNHGYRYLRASIGKLPTRQTRTVQIGLLCEPYNVALPVIGRCYTFGEHWSNLYRKRTPGTQYVAVGSVKTDLLRTLRTDQKKYTVVLGQHINVGKTHNILGFSWWQYLSDVQRVFGEVVFKPHPAMPGCCLPPGVRVGNTLACVAQASLAITLYSTLGLETAACGIPTLSYVPIKSPLVLDFERFGIPVQSKLTGEVPPTRLKKEFMLGGPVMDQIIAREINGQ